VLILSQVFDWYPSYLVFSLLEKVSFGARSTVPGSSIGDNFAPVNGYFDEEELGGVIARGEGGGNYQRTMTTIDSISAAFRIGGLPEGLVISGLCCPKARYRSVHNMPTTQCEICLRVCRSFPLASVMSLECMGSSRNKVQAKRPYGLDVCLSREQIEFIVATRPGGSTMLQSNSRILQLLSTGSRYSVTTEGTSPFIAVKYKKGEVDELKRLIEISELDASKLSVCDVKDAIMKSFSRDGENPALRVTKSSFYLSESSYDSLEELEIPLPDKDTFYCPLEDMLERLPHIAKALTSSHDEGYGDITIDCLKFITRFLEIENNPPIQQIVGCTGLAHKLATIRYPLESRMVAVSALKTILSKGTAEHKKVLVENGVISAFTSLFYSHIHNLDQSTEPLELGVEGLVYLVDGCAKEVLQYLERNRTIPMLVGHLESNQDNVVQGLLKVFAAIATVITSSCDNNNCSMANMEAEVMAHLIRILTSSDKVGILAHACALFSVLLDAGGVHSLRQTFEDLIPRLVELIKRYPGSEMLQVNLLSVSINLSSCVNDQSGAFVNAGFVPVLCDLLYSPIDSVVNKAVSAIGNLAENTLEYRAMALEEGVVSSLLSLLETSFSAEVNTLKVLGICCKGKSSVADAKEGVGVLLGLLDTKDEEFLSSACWSLFHLLDGLSCDELKEVGGKITMSTELIQPLLELLPHSLHRAQEAAIKCLHIMSKMGNECIEYIANGNCLSKLNDLLMNADGAHEKIELACEATSNIFAGNSGQIQAAIDIGMISSILTMLSDQHFRNQRSALHLICQLITVSDNSDHIEYLVSQDVIKLLLRRLQYSDVTMSTMAVGALKCILKVGKEKKNEERGDTGEGGKEEEAKAIEDKLQELIDEHLQLESEGEHLNLLKKKKAWVVYDAQNEHFKSQKEEYELLKTQSNEVQAQLERFEETLAGKASLKSAR